MKTVSQLSAWRDSLAAALKKASAVRDQFRHELQLLEADRPNRSSEFMQAATRALRERYLSEIGKPVADAQQLAKAATADLHYWRSTLFVLSRERFDKDDAASENATRSRHFAELSAMPAALRQMVFEHAKDEGSLPLVYQAWLANEARADQPGWRALDMRGIEVAQQRQALALIGEAVAINGQAENLVAEVSGRRVDNPMAAASRALAPVLEPSLSLDLPGKLPSLEPTIAVADLPAGTPQERLTALREAA